MSGFEWQDLLKGVNSGTFPTNKCNAGPGIFSDATLFYYWIHDAMEALESNSSFFIAHYNK